MKKIKNKIVLATLALGPCFAMAAESIVCPTDTAHAQTLANYKASIKNQVSSQLNLNVDVTNHPLLYVNADAGCDLGFSMPGLPDIGLGLDGIDACALLTSVTGDMVSALNTEMQNTVDQALVDVTGVEDLDFDIDVDLQDVAEDNIN